MTVPKILPHQQATHVCRRVSKIRRVRPVSRPRLEFNRQISRLGSNHASNLVAARIVTPLLSIDDNLMQLSLLNLPKIISGWIMIFRFDRPCKLLPKHGNTVMVALLDAPPLIKKNIRNAVLRHEWFVPQPYNALCDTEENVGCSVNSHVSCRDTSKPTAHR